MPWGHVVSYPPWPSRSRCDIFNSLAYQGRRSYGRQYLRGPLLDGKRNSVEPMAGRLGLPRQNLGHFIAQSTWNQAMRAAR
ncbi:transposase [Nonomuraea lactucae]|uniref:transposase n=1 Tax=Nonomuraea lactucae TaxID=2249762 RepID=UPI0023DD1D19|nr:transposase [Nonomuraea lactucae]